MSVLFWSNNNTYRGIKPTPHKPELFFAAPDWTTYLQYFQLRSSFIRPLQIPRQPDQRIESLPILWQEWDAFNRRWVIPTEFIPDRPPTFQPSQRQDPLPDYNRVYWEPPYGIRVHPPPSLVTGVSQEGVSGIYNQTIPTQEGLFGVKNDIAGFAIYVGSNTLPDLTQPPTSFTQTLPAFVPITLPISGETTFFVIVKRQDHYGLQSVSQLSYTVIVDSSGNWLLPPLLPPTLHSIYQQGSDSLIALVTYPSLVKDPFPPNQWKVWLKTTLPDPNVDLPTLVSTITSQTLSAQLGPVTPGVWYVMVATYRTRDGSLSPTRYNTFTVVGVPPKVSVVPGGFQT